MRDKLVEDVHPEGAPAGAAVASSDGERAPVQVGLRNFCGRSSLLVRQEIAGIVVPSGEGVKVLLGAWIRPQAGDVEEGVGPDLVGSHGHMLLAEGAPALAPVRRHPIAFMSPCLPTVPWSSTCACWTGVAILEQLCADRGSRPPPPLPFPRVPCLVRV
jgi:hypothetical protein